MVTKVRKRGLIILTLVALLAGFSAGVMGLALRPAPAQAAASYLQFKINVPVKRAVLLVGSDWMDSSQVGIPSATNKPWLVSSITGNMEGGRGSKLNNRGEDVANFISADGKTLTFSNIMGDNLYGYVNIVASTSENGEPGLSYLFSYVGTWTQGGKNTAVGAWSGVSGHQVHPTNFTTSGAYAVFNTVIGYSAVSTPTYDVTYNKNGGTGGTASASVGYGNYLSAVVPPTRTGYTFAGYYDALTGGNQYIDASGKGIRNWAEFKAATFYARWTPNSYAVAFNGNGSTGGSMANLAMTYDVSKNLTANGFTKTGYTFAGWATSAGGAVVYTNGASVKNIAASGIGTLYAKWTPNPYTVVFNGNGHTGGSMANLAMTYDAAKNLTANGFTKTGYTFAGWATSAGGAVAYANGASVKNLAVSGTYTLYAKWTANAYTIAFNGNGHTGGSTANLAMTYDAAKNLTANGFTRTGYTFAGWATSAGGTAVYADGASVKNLAPSGTYTLFAKWTANNYTVTFDANKGGGSTDITNLPASKQCTFDAAYGAFAANPARVGYTFGGWYKESTCINKVETTTKYQTAGNTTLYAKWIANTYSVTLSSNGQGQNPAAVTVTFDGKYSALSDLGIRGDYQFLGWFTEAMVGKGEKVTADTDVRTAAAHTLYAQWKKLLSQPTVSGSPYVGETLSASLTAGDTAVYQWYRKNGTVETAIPGAESATYEIMPEDIGGKIFVRITGTGDFAGQVKSSETTQKVIRFFVGGGDETLGEEAEGDISVKNGTVISLTFQGVTVSVAITYNGTREIGEFATMHYRFIIEDGKPYIEAVVTLADGAFKTTLQAGELTSNGGGGSYISDPQGEGFSFKAGCYDGNRPFTVNANFKYIPVTVTFNNNYQKYSEMIGGSELTATKEYEPGGVIDEAYSGFAVAMNKIAYWSPSATDTDEATAVKLILGTTLAPNESGKVTYYAHWRADENSPVVIYYEASDRDLGYATLADAIDALNRKDKITKDVTIYINQDLIAFDNALFTRALQSVDKSVTITIQSAEGKFFTVDGNGKTFTTESADFAVAVKHIRFINYCFIAKTGAKLTIGEGAELSSEGNSLKSEGGVLTVAGNAVIDKIGAFNADSIVSSAPVYISGGMFYLASRARINGNIVLTIDAAVQSRVTLLGGVETKNYLMLTCVKAGGSQLPAGTEGQLIVQSATSEADLTIDKSENNFAVRSNGRVKVTNSGITLVGGNFTDSTFGLYTAQSATIHAMRRPLENEDLEYTLGYKTLADALLAAGAGETVYIVGRAVNGSVNPSTMTQGYAATLAISKDVTLQSGVRYVGGNYGTVVTIVTNANDTVTLIGDITIGGGATLTLKNVILAAGTATLDDEGKETLSAVKKGSVSGEGKLNVEGFVKIADLSTVANISGRLTAGSEIVVSDTTLGREVATCGDRFNRADLKCFILGEGQTLAVSENGLSAKIYMSGSAELKKGDVETKYDTQPIVPGVDIVLETTGTGAVKYSYLPYDPSMSSYEEYDWAAEIAGLPSKSGRYVICASVENDDASYQFGGTAYLDFTILQSEVELFNEKYEALCGKDTAAVTAGDRAVIEQALQEAKALKEVLPAYADIADIDGTVAKLEERLLFAKAAAFKEKHADLIGADIAQITKDHAAAIDGALEEFAALPQEIQALLTAEKADLDVKKVKADFKAAHDGVLSKSLDEITEEDTAALTAAKQAYEQLGDAAKQALEAEYSDILQKSEKAEYLNNHRAILEKALKDITAQDLTAIDKALAALEAIDDAATLDSLSEQKNGLLKKRSRAVFLKDHAAVLNQTLSDAAEEHRQSLDNAIDHLSGLDDDVRATLTGEETHLTNQLHKINFLASHAAVLGKESGEVKHDPDTALLEKAEAEFAVLPDAVKEVLQPESDNLTAKKNVIKKKQQAKAALAEHIAGSGELGEDVANLIARAEEEIDSQNEATLEALEQKLTEIVGEAKAAIDEARKNEIAAWRENNKTVLDLALKDVNGSHKVAISLAAADYDQLSDFAKEALKSEKADLDAKLARIDFLENNDEILRKRLSDTAEADRASVEKAIADFDALSSENQLTLGEQIKQLKDKLAKIDFLKDHADILSKSPTEITKSDLAAATAAEGAWNALPGEVQKELAAEKFGLDQKKALAQIADFSAAGDSAAVKEIAKAAADKIIGATAGGETNVAEVVERAKDEMSLQREKDRVTSELTEKVNALKDSGKYSESGKQSLSDILDRVTEEIGKIAITDEQDLQQAKAAISALKDSANGEVKEVKIVSTGNILPPDENGNVTSDEDAEYPETGEGDTLLGKVENSDGMDSEINLVVKKTERETELAESVKKNGEIKNKEIQSTLDVNLYKDGAVIDEHDGIYQVKVLMPVKMRSSVGLVIAKVNADGSLSVIESRVEGKYLYFSTEEFGEFVVVADRQSANLLWLTIVLSILILLEIAWIVFWHMGGKKYFDKGNGANAAGGEKQSQDVKLACASPVLLAALSVTGALSVAEAVVALLLGGYIAYLFLKQNGTWDKLLSRIIPKKAEAESSAQSAEDQTQAESLPQANDARLSENMSSSQEVASIGEQPSDTGSNKTAD